MAGRRVYGGSSMSVIHQNEGIACSPEFLQSLLISTSSPTYPGSRSMFNFKDVGGGNPPNSSFFQPFEQEENEDDELDECFHQPEKKRRLTADQVQFLERNFELENKLEPERKIQLARDLGLQPRQVAIWFQNRRARWKTKQLEKDYQVLKASYDSLKTDYENLLKETDKLKTEVHCLTDKLLLKGKERENLEPIDPSKQSNPPPQKSIPNLSLVEKASNVPILICKQEDLSSTNSDVFDSDCPNHTDAGHSSLLEPADSSHVFEAEQSDLSQDEGDNLSRSLYPSVYNFPKLEDAVYSDLPATSCNYGTLVEDQSSWFWS